MAFAACCEPSFEALMSLFLICDQMDSIPTVFRRLPCNACGFSILWRPFSSSSGDMVLLFSIHSCLEFLVSFGFCFFFFRPLMEIPSLAVVRKIRLWSVYNGSNRPLNSIPHDIFLSSLCSNHHHCSAPWESKLCPYISKICDFPKIKKQCFHIINQIVFLRHPQLWFHGTFRYMTAHCYQGRFSLQISPPTEVHSFYPHASFK